MEQIRLTSSAAATPAPSSAMTTNKNIILRTPDQRRSIAELYMFMLTERGPRKLEGVQREYAESREFGPLIEFLTDEDLEKMLEDGIDVKGTRQEEGFKEICALSTCLITLFYHLTYMYISMKLNVFRLDCIDVRFKCRKGRNS